MNIYSYSFSIEISGSIEAGLIYMQRGKQEVDLDDSDLDELQSEFGADDDDDDTDFYFPAEVPMPLKK